MNSPATGYCSGIPIPMGCALQVQGGGRPGVHLSFVLLVLFMAWSAMATGCGTSSSSTGDGQVDEEIDSGWPEDAGPGPDDTGFPDTGSDEEVQPPGTPSPAPVPDSPPTVQWIEPAQGPTRGGTEVVVVGRGFSLPVIVTIGEQLVGEVEFHGREELRFRTPPSEPGRVDIMVETARGIAGIGGAFTYIPDLSLDSTNPSQTTTEGGASFILQGSGFQAHPGTVFIGEREVIGMEVLDDRTISGYFPPAPAGLHDLTYYGRDFKVDVEGAVLYVQAPQIGSLEPLGGPLEGGTVLTVNGGGFTAGARVSLGGLEGDLLGVSHDGRTMTFVAPDRSEMPDGVGLVDLHLEDEGGEATKAGAYFYHRGLLPGDAPPDSPLSVDGVLPGQGPARGGNTIDVFGAGMGGGERIFIGPAEAECQTVSPVRATCVVPEGVRPDGDQAPLGVDWPVEVTITSGDGQESAQLPGGYWYRRELSVSSVVPSEGPGQGGTRVTLQGEGFHPPLRAWVGVLKASDVQIIDDRTLTLISPPGMVGPSEVRLIRGDLDTPYAEVSVPQGFQYTGQPEIFEVAPAQGSMAGNTLVELVGTGFSQGLEVRFGAGFGLSPQVTHGNRITVRAPAASLPSTVDVSVLFPSPGVPPESARKAAAYRYYSPMNGDGGVWGGPISGSVNVAVVDRRSLRPLEGAYVVMGDEADNFTKGWTDHNGLLTFSETDLSGRRTVSAIKDQYSASTIAGFDAANATLMLMPRPVVEEPPPPPDNGEDPPLPPRPQTSTIRGHLSGMDKNFAETGNPDEVRVAYLTTSSATTHGFNMLPDPGPGAMLFTNGQYVLNSRPGHVAVFAVGGVKNTVTGDFRPVVMGVRRHIFLNPGDDRSGIDITLDVPMDQVAKLEMDSPPIRPEGPNTLTVDPYLILGGDDGVWDLYSYIRYAGRPLQRLELPHMPALDGALADSSLHLRSGAYTGHAGGGRGQPYAISYMYGIDSVGEDILVGPWVGVPILHSPLSDGPLMDNTLSWEIFGGTRIPDGQSFSIISLGTVPGSAWDIFIAGDIRTLNLPDFRGFVGFPAGERVTMGMQPVLNPGFNINEFVLWDFYSSSVESFAINYNFFTF